MAAIIAFNVSLGALLLFLAFKFLERSRKWDSYAALREKGDSIVLSTLTSLKEKGLKLEKQLSARNITQVSVYRMASIVANTARRIEGHAHNVTRKMSRNGNGEARATNSAFLKEVSTHKSSLDTDRVRRETSLTDTEE